MAAALVNVTVVDGSGASRVVQMLSSDGTLTGTLSAAHVTLDHTGTTVLDETQASPVTQSGVWAVGLSTGANTVGNVGVVAGSAIIGKVGIDQTTPGTTNAVVLTPRATANGITSSRVVSAATTNATSLKASAGNIYQIDLFNVATYDIFVKFYDKGSAPTVGTDTPVWTIPIKAGTGYARSFHMGRSFATGIAYAITKLQADSDTTAVAASDVTGVVGWV